MAGDRPVPIIDEAGYSLAARRALSTSLAQYMIPALVSYFLFVALLTNSESELLLFTLNTSLLD